MISKLTMLTITRVHSPVKANRAPYISALAPIRVQIVMKLRR